MSLIRLAAALLGTACFACASDAAVLAGWSQYGKDGQIEARIVTDDSACPVLIADGTSLPMSERSAPTPAFPGRVCVAVAPTGSKSLSAGGHVLPVAVAKPHHIVVIGDTGCRLKGPLVQACNDENAWPFLKVASHAALEHPDLVIHVGDYLYRETPCLPGDERCAGTPWGDNWPTWNADLLAPAHALFDSAVWLMARGNHEDCKRAGTGWTILFGRDPATNSCNSHEKPLLVDLDGVKVAVLDENNANETDAKSDIAALIKGDIATIMAARADWIVTHHPFRGVSKPPKAAGKTVDGSNATLIAATQGLDESPLSLLLAGHIHNFQIVNFGGTLAPQLVVGEGGDKLDVDVPPDLTGLVTGGQTVTQGTSLPGFGYVVLDRDGGGQDWLITVHAADGVVMRHCALKARKLSCQG